MYRPLPLHVNLQTPIFRGLSSVINSGLSEELFSRKRPPSAANAIKKSYVFFGQPVAIFQIHLNVAFDNRPSNSHDDSDSAIPVRASPH